MLLREHYQREGATVKFDRILVVTIIAVILDWRKGLSFSQKLFSERKVHLVIVYGKRKVGRTRLVLELHAKKTDPYFHVTLGGRYTVLSPISRVPIASAIAEALAMELRPALKSPSSLSSS